MSTSNRPRTYHVPLVIMHKPVTLQKFDRGDIIYACEVHSFICSNDIYYNIIDIFVSIYLIYYFYK